MALDGGGGGGGGPLGFANSFTGLSESLDYVGDHVFGVGSHSSDASQNFGTLLDFKTPDNSYIVADITCFGAVDPAIPANGEASNFKISMNDSVIAYVNIDTSQEDQPSVETIPLIIFGGSQIKIEANAASSAWVLYGWITGRVYR